MPIPTFSRRLMQKWFDLDAAFRSEHSFTAAAIVGVSKDSEVAVFFSPALDKHEVAHLSAALREQSAEPWPDKPQAGQRPPIEPPTEWAIPEEEVTSWMDATTRLEQLLRDVPDEEVVRWHRTVCMFSGLDWAIQVSDRREAISHLALTLRNADLLAQQRRDARRAQI